MQQKNLKNGEIEKIKSKQFHKQINYLLIYCFAVILGLAACDQAVKSGGNSSNARSKNAEAIIIDNSGQSEASTSGSTGSSFSGFSGSTISSSSTSESTPKTSAQSQSSSTLAPPPAGTYRISGKISGLIGKIILQNKDEEIPVQKDGSFTFIQPVKDGGDYGVFVKMQPDTQECTVKQDMGKVSGSNVANIQVDCGEIPPPPDPKMVKIIPNPSINNTSGTDKYRLTFGNDPATTMTIGWNQWKGSNPVLYYGTEDHDRDWNAYTYSKNPDAAIPFLKMNTHFVRLTNLEPGTAYFFVIRDSEGVSRRFWFRTTFDSPEHPFSFIAGGDSRSHRETRQMANRMVSKLRPLFVVFDGDYVKGYALFPRDPFSSLAIPGQWRDWLDDWQMTIGPDGLLIPIVPAQGNHEYYHRYSKHALKNFLDIRHKDFYFQLTFGGNLLRIFTLNSEISTKGDQRTWLEAALQRSSNIRWKMAQYHRPIRPHAKSKTDLAGADSAWGPLFEKYGMDLVLEADAHLVKTTYPIVYSHASGNEDGYKRDDERGTVYVGEGSWGAPTRDADDNRSWTRASGNFNQFKWIYVTNENIEVRTVKYTNVHEVDYVPDSNPYYPLVSPNLDLWTPKNGTGSVVIIGDPNGKSPSVKITSPTTGSGVNAGQEIRISVTVSNDVDYVKFLVNGTEIDEVSGNFSTSWLPSESGKFKIHAIAFNGKNQVSTDAVTIVVDTKSITRTVIKSSDDAEEYLSGKMEDLDSSDLELIHESLDEGLGRHDQIVGIRFAGIGIPKGAKIVDAFIQFHAKYNDDRNTVLYVQAEAADNSTTFREVKYNISSRSRSKTKVEWFPSPWKKGHRGAAQRTPNLATLIQETIERDGWKINNAITFIFSGRGDSQRVGYSWDTDNGSKAPALTIVYSSDEEPQKIGKTYVFYGGKSEGDLRSTKVGGKNALSVCRSNRAAQRIPGTNKNTIVFAGSWDGGKGDHGGNDTSLKNMMTFNTVHSNNPRKDGYGYATEGVETEWPVYAVNRSNGAKKKFANSWTKLWKYGTAGGGPLVSLVGAGVIPAGNDQSTEWWSGANEFGNGKLDCSDWHSDSSWRAYGDFGIGNKKSDEWIDKSSAKSRCNKSKHFICATWSLE